MAGTDVVVYLNGDSALMGGSFKRAVDSLPAKLLRAPSKEWRNTFKSLVSKGLVKQAEVDDSDIDIWLNMQGDKSVNRTDLVEAIEARQVTIKEVTLGSPQYKNYSHAGLAGPAAQYKEVLFIANSQRANVEDRIEEIDWELEQFNFDIARLSEDPEALFRLTDERELLLKNSKSAYEFKWTHFVRDDLGRHGKNLIAHARELTAGNTYLVEEIQSDWGQRGRMTEWRDIQKGPFVTDTKLWAGLAMRRMMQRAALNPKVEKFFWIRGSMRNGGAQVKKDNLDEFYLKVMASIVDKVISPAGQKCRLDTLRLGDTALADVPCFDMTPEVRELLKKTLPLYSLSNLLPRPAEISVEHKAALMDMAKGMIGSARNVRLVNHVYDIVLGQEVAGSYINGMVQASLRAPNLPDVLNHECFHFGMDKLFTLEERRMVEASFAPGTELNNRVKDLLLRDNDRAAFEQTRSAEEAAAYGFAYWSAGKLDLQPSPVKGLFQSLRDVIAEGMSWFRKTAMDQKVTTPEELFTAFARGDYAAKGERLQPSLYRAAEVRRPGAEAVRG